MSSVSEPESRPTGFRWRWNGRLVVLCLLLLPLTVTAGFWQLRRADEKRDLLAIHAQRSQAAPVALAHLDLQEEQQYRRVTVTGWPDQAHQFLLDNRMRHGRAGYEVLTPVRWADDGWIMVNRGWLPRPADGSGIPAVPRLSEPVTLVGYLYQAAAVAPVLGPEQPGADWPQVLQQPVPGLLVQRLGRDILPYQLRLEDSPGFETGWTVASLSPDQHIGYAVQWFGLSVVLAVLGVISNSNFPEWWRARRRSEAND